MPSPCGTLRPTPHFSLVHRPLPASCRVSAVPSSIFRYSAGDGSDIISLLRSTAPLACLAPPSDLWLAIAIRSRCLFSGPLEEIPVNLIPSHVLPISSSPPKARRILPCCHDLMMSATLSSHGERENSLISGNRTMLTPILPGRQNEIQCLCFFFEETGISLCMRHLSSTRHTYSWIAVPRSQAFASLGFLAPRCSQPGPALGLQDEALQSSGSADHLPGWPGNRLFL